MDRIVTRIDEWLFRIAANARAYVILAQRATRFLVTRPFYWRDELDQMDRLGVGSLPILALTGAFTGMVLALQSAVQLQRFGAAMYVGNLVGASMIRELGPVLAGLMLAGRAGSGIAAEIGSMRVTEQIDALESMGTDPIRKLVAPRLLALVVMLPALTVLTDVIGIIGGMLIATFTLEIPAYMYLAGVINTIADSGFVLGFFPVDLVLGLVKPITFGAIIALTGSYCGLSTRGGTEGVGRATTRAVVVSSILILASNYFLTSILLTLLYDTA